MVSTIRNTCRRAYHVKYVSSCVPWEVRVIVRTIVRTMGSIRAIVSTMGSIRAIVLTMGSIRAIGRTLGTMCHRAYLHWEACAIVRTMGSIRAIVHTMRSIRAIVHTMRSIRAIVHTMRSIRAVVHTMRSIRAIVRTMRRCMYGVIRPCSMCVQYASVIHTYLLGIMHVLLVVYIYLHTVHMSSLSIKYNSQLQQSTTLALCC